LQVVAVAETAGVRGDCDKTVELRKERENVTLSADFFRGFKSLSELGPL
jgi:hypothetical protein